MPETVDALVVLLILAGIFTAGSIAVDIWADWINDHILPTPDPESDPDDAAT